MGKKLTDDQPRVYFDCNKCPAFCCSVYERVQVTPRDLKRLAKHFGVTPETAQRKYTKRWKDERVLRRTGDEIFEDVCMFLDQKTRGCSIYHARPEVCREYPARSRCAYYDLMQFERKQQADDTCIPLIQITFHTVKTEEVKNDNTNGRERVWEWTPEERK